MNGQLGDFTLLIGVPCPSIYKDCHGAHLVFSRKNVSFHFVIPRVNERCLRFTHFQKNGKGKIILTILRTDLYYWPKIHSYSVWAGSTYLYRCQLTPLMYTAPEIRPWPYDQVLTIGFPQYDLIKPEFLRGGRLTSHDISDSYKYNW